MKIRVDAEFDTETGRITLHATKGVEPGVVFAILDMARMEAERVLLAEIGGKVVLPGADHRLSHPGR